MSDSAWLVAPKRTPIGRFLGDLSSLPATSLGASSLRATVQESGINPLAINEVIMGQVLMAGAGQAPARQAMHGAGLPDSIAAATVNKVCGSGLYAVFLAQRAIVAGDCSVVLAGGMESMSQAPFLTRGARTGWKYGSQTLLDVIEQDGLRCSRSGQMMGEYAEQVAKQYSLSREDLDQWAVISHSRALAAQERGDFLAELVPVPVNSSLMIHHDSGPRTDTSLTTLAKLKPAFHPQGSVTAGNASTLSDGAASVLVVSDSVRHHELKHQAAFRIVTTAISARPPGELFIAPVDAIEQILRKSGLGLAQIDLIEINEAFASQTLACMKLLGLDGSNVNVNGGAIALGHPIGCSGTRILVTLASALRQRGLKRGIASLCLGGGEAVAALIEYDEPRE